MSGSLLTPAGSAPGLRIGAPERLEDRPHRAGVTGTLGRLFCKHASCRIPVLAQAIPNLIQEQYVLPAVRKLLQAAETVERHITPGFREYGERRVLVEHPCQQSRARTTRPDHENRGIATLNFVDRIIADGHRHLYDSCCWNGISLGAAAHLHPNGVRQNTVL